MAEDRCKINHKSTKRKSRRETKDQNAKVEDMTNNDGAADMKESSKIFKCKKCQFTTKFKRNLDNHRSVHSTDKPYKCQKCTYESKHKRHLKKHEKKHTENGEKHLIIHATDSPKKCKYCEFTSSSKKFLKTHEKRHTDHQPYRCADCDEKFSDVKERKKHEKTHNTNAKRHKRETRGKSFLEKRSLSRSKFERFSNGKCDYALGRRVQLEKPANIHSREIRFKCSRCNYSSDLQRNLSKHELSHKDQPTKGFRNFQIVIQTDQLSHQCPRCHKCFPSNYALEIHVRTHTGEKPYKCPRCECTFNYKQNVIVHVKSHNDGKSCMYCRCENVPVYKCKHCSYECDTMLEFTKHISSNHLECGNLRELNVDSPNPNTFENTRHLDKDCHGRVEKPTKEQITSMAKKRNSCSKTDATFGSNGDSIETSSDSVEPVSIKEEPMDSLNNIKLSSTIKREEVIWNGILQTLKFMSNECQPNMMM